MNYTTKFSNKPVSYRDVEPGTLFYVLDVKSNPVFYLKSEETDEGDNCLCLSDNYITSFSYDSHVFIPQAYNLEISI